MDDPKFQPGAIWRTKGTNEYNRSYLMLTVVKHGEGEEWPTYVWIKHGTGQGDFGSSKNLYDTLINLYDYVGNIIDSLERIK